MNPVSLTNLQHQILQTVENSSARLTVTDIMKLMAGDTVDRKTLQKKLKLLMASGELVFNSINGHTFVEKSFYRPVRLSRHVLVAPEGHAIFPEQDDIAVIIRHGVAFGTGQHPSTRLAVQALDDLLLDEKKLLETPESGMLDIGTGSGILAIASLKMGIHQAICLDYDPCARFETLENARLNGVHGRMHVMDSELDLIPAGFDLITANLRFPTLFDLFPEIDRLTRPGSYVVFAGIKCDETELLCQKYQSASFQSVWAATEHEWAGIIFKKTGTIQDDLKSEIRGKGK